MGLMALYNWLMGFLAPGRCLSAMSFRIGCRMVYGSRRLALCLFLPVCVVFGGNVMAQSHVFVPANNPLIAYMGRISWRNPAVAAFTYPGVSIYANFEGTSLRMAAKPGSGDFMVEIDGGMPYRLVFSGNDSVHVLAEGLAEGVHSVRLMYAVEGLEFRPEFRGFYLDAGKGLVSPPTLPGRRIEFIGNSITCGYGTESDDASAPFSYDTENHYYTYAALTARALGAQHLVVARSGIGIYRNYGGSRSGSPDCMPAMYEQTLFLDSTELWNHDRYVPDVICVNLGTNDVSDGNYDCSLLTGAYIKFTKHLREVYPKAKIVLLSGVMLNGKQLDDVKRAMDTAVAEMKSGGDDNVFRFDMTPQTGSLGYGANWHPSMRQHQKMARELTAYLKDLMDW